MVTTLFLLSAFRAIVEMLGLCMIGQGVLYVLAGRSRASNKIYQLFDLITTAPRHGVAFFLRGASDKAIGVICFAILLLLWLGLAYIRKSI